MCSESSTNVNFSCSSAQDTLDCLRAVDVNSLVNANLESMLAVSLVLSFLSLSSMEVSSPNAQLSF